MDDAAAQLQADLDARRVRRLFADERGPASVPQAYALQRRLRAVREARGEARARLLEAAADLVLEARGEQLVDAREVLLVEGRLQPRAPGLQQRA